MDARYQAKARPVETLSSQGGMIARVECSSCGGHSQWRMAALPEPSIVKRHFTVKGWNLKSRAICPQCLSRNKEAKKMNAVTKIEPKPTVKLAADSDAARKNKRLVVIALEDYYDDAARRYRSGRSDQSVADELDLAPGFVALVREEFYGKMAAPSEITELRDEVVALTRNLDAVRAKLADVVAKNGWCIDMSAAKP